MANQPQQKSLIEQIMTDGIDSIFALGCAFCTFCGILVNYIVVLSVWGYLHAMYPYIMYGYIAGFIVTGVFMPLAFIGIRWVMINIKSGHASTLRTLALTGSWFFVFLTIVMMILAIFL